jgi:formate dehydrogenase maturation protein FdhE
MKDLRFICPICHKFTDWKEFKHHIKCTECGHEYHDDMPSFQSHITDKMKQETFKWLESNKSH